MAGFEPLRKVRKVICIGGVYERRLPPGTQVFDLQISSWIQTLVRLPDKRFRRNDAGISGRKQRMPAGCFLEGVLEGQPLLPWCAASNTHRPNGCLEQ